ncbi:BTB/POZ protein [Rhizophagus clarus]|uniref:BTB/POZ protein n=1 Tax=Rhizophagus clarus TaxID=94130 RepID=A0A8H3LRI5_9GLOM|nr:BTB/POZ protein [Rhizophagus clarus]
MSTQFFSKLSQNYIELLKDDEYYDITIEVGEDPNNKDNVLAHVKLPNISPEIFQIIIEYIYGGILSLNERDTSDFLKILIAADELHLQELIDYLQKYLIDNKSVWIEQHFGFTQKISSKSNNFLELQEFCTNLMAQFPEKIFKSFDFTSLSEKSLISLIKMDDLQMKEIEVWEHVLEWGLAQNHTLNTNNPDPNDWSDDDFKKMKNTLQHCLPSIRLFSLSSEEFLKIRPYKKLLNNQLYEDIINSHMNPSVGPTDKNIVLPRNIKTERFICSKIVDLVLVSAVSKWIDKAVIIINGKFDHNIKDAIFSNIQDTAEYAVCYCRTDGPIFGRDIVIRTSNESTNYNDVRYKKDYYEKRIRDTDDKFQIEDYEVFKIMKK